MNKVMLRKKVKLKIQQLRPNQKTFKSKVIFKKIINSNLLQTSKIIGLYYSNANEVDTHKLLVFLLNNHKIVCLPRINDVKQITMHQINSWDFLFDKKFNIKQPLSSYPLCEPATIEIMILPGLAFDEHKNRLGQGGGYYDKFLQTAFSSSCLKIMLAFEIQKVSNIVVDAWDVKVDYIFTEQKIY